MDVENMDVDLEEVSVVQWDPNSVDDLETRNLTVVWTIPNGISKIKQIHENLQLAYSNDCQSLVIYSDEFANQELNVQNFLSTRNIVPKWKIVFKPLYYWNNHNHISLYLSRTDPPPTPTVNAFGWKYPKPPPTTNSVYQFDILNVHGDSVIKRESRYHVIEEESSFGWPCFATYSQLLENKAQLGPDLVIKCTVMIDSRKPKWTLKLPTTPQETPNMMNTGYKLNFNWTNNANNSTGTTITEISSSTSADSSKNESNKKVRILKAVAELKKKNKKETNKLKKQVLTIICGEEIITANTIPLAARSKWFARLFSETDLLASPGDPLFEIKNEDAKFIKAMIQFLCKDTCTLLDNGSFDERARLLTYAHKYEIEDLKQDVVKKLMSTIDNEHVIELIMRLKTHGMLTKNKGENIEPLQQYILDNKEEIMKTEVCRSDPNGWARKLMKVLF